MSTVSANPHDLGPPNHKLVPVSVSVSDADTCDPHPVCKITTITSNEPVEGTEKDEEKPGWVMTGNLTVKLRAERAEKRKGRSYTLTVHCTDASGNSATQPVTVTVPHDRGQ